MTALTLRAYALLVSFESVILHRDFKNLYRRVRSQPIRDRAPDQAACERVRDAIDRACVLYFKPVQCLQRSAATVCLLLRSGVMAQLVIGAQSFPFRAHAWVEVEGIVVNDKISVTETYAVLDRC